MQLNLLRASIGLVVLVGISCGSLRAQAPAPNDSCANAIAVGVGSTPGNNSGATTGPDPIPTCGAMLSDVWYSYTATCTGTVIASLCPPGSANFDTVMAAWAGPCSCLNPLACNDDFCGTSSRVEFNVVAGTTYHISIGGFDGAVGSFVLNIMCGTLNPPPVIPPNDYCSGALGLLEGVVTSGTNVNATTGGNGCPGDPVGSCSVVSKDVWYSFFASCSGPYEAKTCAGTTAFDTVVTVWDGTGGCGNLVELSCNDDAGCGLPNQALSSTAAWNATAGTLYYVSVGGYQGALGAFSLVVGQANLTLALNAGVGSLGYALTGGPPNGIGFTGITTTQGAFPNGPFFGIELTLQDLLAQISAGFPFLTTLSLCGSVSAGPYNGLPPGFTVYAVSLAAPAGSQTATAISAPVTATVF